MAIPPDAPSTSLPPIEGFSQEDLRRLSPFRPPTEEELIQTFFGDINLRTDFIEESDRRREEIKNAKEFVSGFPSAGIDTFSGTDTQVYVVLYGKELLQDEEGPARSSVVDETLNHKKTIPQPTEIAGNPLSNSQISHLYDLAQRPATTLDQIRNQAIARAIIAEEEKRISSNTERRANSVFIRKIGDAQTFTLSTFREKPSVRALGNISVRGHARGSRTCAGTIIFTDFFFPSIYEFLIPQDGDTGSSSGAYTLLDQIPPFDVILYRRNEFGLASYQFVSGLEFVTTGKVISVHDLFTEKTVSYKAIDFSEEIPADWKAVKNRLNSLAWRSTLAGGTPGKRATSIISKFASEWDSRNRRFV